MRSNTGGYNGKVDIFTIPSQHIKNCSTAKEAIIRAKAMDNNAAFNQTEEK